MRNSPSEAKKLGLEVGNLVEFAFQIIVPNKKSLIPADLQEVLDQEGMTLTDLSVEQRWQLIMMVKEAKNPEVRKMRIEAGVSACKKKKIN